MADITIKRDGSWAVELSRPLIKANGHRISTLVIRPLKFDQTIRIMENDVVSAMSLLAEMCDLPERLLRELVSPDSELALLAFYNVLPEALRTTVRELPLATPKDELPEPDAPEAEVVDQEDPRFPQSDEPVQRFPTPPVVNIPEQEVGEPGLNIEPAGEMRQVN
jgi:hypothetical protein